MSDEIFVGLSDENSDETAAKVIRSPCVCMFLERRGLNGGYMRAEELEYQRQCMTARVKGMMGESGTAKRGTALLNTNNFVTLLIHSRAAAAQHGITANPGQCQLGSNGR